VLILIVMLFYLDK